MLKQIADEIVPRAANFVHTYGKDHSLSEILALEGFFPLFGMPVRNATLIHENPNGSKNARQFPLEKGKIDRSLDIAISEFAPGCELVKDKQIIHCVGVAWPEPEFDARGTRWIKSGNPKNPKPMMVCRNCQTISFQDRLICEGCATAGERLHRYTSWTPPAFVADFAGSRLYDGNVDKSSKQVLAFPSGLDLDHPESTSESEQYRTSSYPGTLIRTNTNNFEGYNFTKITAPGLRGLFLEDGVAVAETSHWREPRYLSTQTDHVALTTERKTDILLVRANKWPIHFSHSGLSNKYKVQAAWASLAEILGKAIILREDIEPSEISVGIRYECDDSNTSVRRDLWSVFIADNLDNGAGYSSNYATKKSFEELLDYASTRIRGNLLKKTHRERCFSSCPDCLRHYGNRFGHAQLDWRLGLDLLDMLCGHEPSLAMVEEHWSQLAGTRAKRRLEDSGLPGLVAEAVGDYNLLRLSHESKSYGIVPIHPLANFDFFKIDELRDELSEQSGLPIKFCCPYELERQPLAQIQEIREFVKQRQSN
jgi:hypothetical protein